MSSVGQSIRLRKAKLKEHMVAGALRALEARDIMSAAGKQRALAQTGAGLFSFLIVLFVF